MAIYGKSQMLLKFHIYLKMGSSEAKLDYLRNLAQEIKKEFHWLN